MPNISDTPGTYPVTIIDAVLGDVSENGSKPVLKLTYQDSAGGTIEHTLYLYGGALEISLRTLDKSLSYKFEADPSTLKGKSASVVTDYLPGREAGKSFYGVKWLNGVSKALSAPAPNLLASLQAAAKRLPPEAPRAARPAAAPRPSAAPRPAPTQSFADDESVPF